MTSRSWRLRMSILHPHAGVTEPFDGRRLQKPLGQQVKAVNAVVHDLVDHRSLRSVGPASETDAYERRLVELVAVAGHQDGLVREPELRVHAVGDPGGGQGVEL